MSSAELLELADRLYGEPVAGFTAARDAAAKAAGTREQGAAIKAWKKPSVSAWAINLLVRREGEQIDQVLELAASLRAAAESLDGEELRTLTRQRRQLTAALTTTASRLAREHEVRLTAAVSDQVEGMLTAAMLDPVAAQVVRSGLVITAFTSTGVSELDVTTVCALPEAIGHRPASVEPGPPTLRVVPDDGIRLEAATERFEEATLEAATAREQLEHATAAGEKLQARRLQLQGEIDELRRRLAGLEDDVEALDEDIEAADEAIDEAAGDLADAEQLVTDAQTALAKLAE
jgi:hypothetical protein